MDRNTKIRDRSYSRSKSRSPIARNRSPVQRDRSPAWNNRTRSQKQKGRESNEDQVWRNNNENGYSGRHKDRELQYDVFER